MTLLRDVMEALEAFAPLAWQEEWDNSGLQVGESHQPVRAVLLTLDVTESSIDQALEQGCDLIVSHHPLLFRGIRQVTDATPVERIVARALRRGIAIYSCHTNIDNAPGGVNVRLAERLGIRPEGPLVPSAHHPQVGAGRIGTLEEPLPLEAFLERTARLLGVGCLRHAGGGGLVRRVALCGGSGSEFIDTACRQADLYLTADLKYHDFQRAAPDFALVDAGHYETEQQVLEIFSEQISKKIPTFAVRRGDSPSNPVNYFTLGK